MLQIANKADFDFILHSNSRVAVGFIAAWCGPCKSIAPKFEAFAEKFASIKFIKVDVDENSETAETYDVSAMPTFLFFKNGKKYGERLVGADKNKLEEKLNELANS
jgi:thioredoxin 1